MKKFLAILLSLSMIFSLFACGKSDGAGGVGATEPTTPETEETWSIYWYLCGSDLESYGGMATLDLQEMEAVTLPENVNVIIQTGGASQWQHEGIKADKTQRWLYNSEGLQLLEELPAANMGKSETLEDFLSYGHTNYPADREGLILWNHGGGTVGGVAFDECYGYDSLSLTEIGDAMGQVYADAKLEFVGFDACLMATIDVAAVLEPYANYMVASQENEPGVGWEYTGWLSALAKDPAMTGAELGIAICDAYYAGCVEEDQADQITLSVIDLSKVGALLEAYEAFGAEALVMISEQDDFYAQMGRAAWRCENYGGNSSASGYSNMIDLGSFAREMESLLPCAADVQDALEGCVVYNVKGEYCPDAGGLSCYYTYSGNLIKFYNYYRQGVGTSFKYLYAYGIAKEFLLGAQAFLGDLGIIELPESDTVYSMGWDNYPLYIDDDACAVLDLGADANRVLTNLQYCLYWFDEEGEYAVDLGAVSDITCDWENGVFQENFYGVWGAIDDNLVYMEIVQSNSKHNIYAIPILLNGEVYILQVAFEKASGNWEILGAAQSIDTDNMGSKDLRKLQAGDEVTTIWAVRELSNFDEYEWYEVDTFTVTNNTSFGEYTLEDGIYGLTFRMYDGSGNVASSDFAYYEIIDGDIYTTLEYPG